MRSALRRAFSWADSWPLGWRVFGSFAFALVALAVAGGVAIWQLRRDDLAFHRIVERSSLVSELAVELRAAHLAARLGEHGAAVDPDEAERVRDLRRQLAAFAPTMTELEREQLAAFDRAWSGSPSGQVQEADRALHSLAGSVSERRRAESGAAMAAVRETSERVVIVLGLTTLVGLVIALLAARTTAQAVRQSGATAQAAKFRALGQLAGGVAHDVNQSLGIIAGYGELAFEALSRPQPDLVRAREGLELITRAAMDAGETIARLLRFTRTAPDGPAERVEMGDLLADVAKLTAPRWRDTAQTERRTITVEVATTGETAIVGWPSRLREALTNLVFNAVDALPNGGTIRLSARPTPRGVEVAVSDDGIGMSPEVRAHAFEPFFTTKGERGTGLGLAVVFGIVEQHGGTIDVDSAPGAGTTFVMTFPTAPADLAVPDEPAPPPGIRRLRVLAIDDEPALARLIALMLRRHGHRVTVAESGEEALELLGDEPYDLVVSDLGLGDGITGWELAEEVRRRWPTMRFVLATGWGAEIDPAQARQRGVDAVISKPYRLRDLERVVQVPA